MSIFKVRLSWHVSMRILYIKNTHPHRHEFLHVCPNPQHFHCAPQQHTVSSAVSFFCVFYSSHYFSFQLLVDAHSLSVQSHIGLHRWHCRDEHWCKKCSTSDRSHDLFDFDCETGEFKWETHKPYHSGCPMEMTPFEAQKCKGPVMSEKANGNRRAKFGGNRKPRARGDHACHTYQRGFRRGNNVSGISWPLRGAERSNANELLLPTARTSVQKWLLKSGNSVRSWTSFLALSWTHYA